VIYNFIVKFKVSYVLFQDACIESCGCQY